MKRLTIIILVLITIISCSKDDDKTAISDNDSIINQLEETVLNATTVLDNLKINGAIKKAGAPTTNGDINFQLDNPSTSAFLKKGFAINFKESSDTFIGAYLQIKSTDGKLADGYWDITNLSSKSSGIKNVKRNTKQLLVSKSSLTHNSIIVNFLDAIKPGRFCYVVCVYNEVGVISEPVEVCVEIENWGGYSDLIGTWKFLSQEYIENGVSNGINNVGENDCEDDYFYCTTTQAQIVYEYCDKIISLDLIFNGDGTYLLEEDYESSDIDYEASQSNCVAVGIYETEHYRSEGKWAFEEEENILTIVEFYYDYGDGESETIPNGEFVFQGKALLNNNILTVKVTENDGTYNDEWISKFSKK